MSKSKPKQGSPSRSTSSKSSKVPTPALTAPEAVSPEIAAAPSPDKKPAFFRRCDWIAFGVTTLVTLIGYLLTLAPDLTLEDSGELAVGSYYAGVPHPPGYPVWTLYTWFFTVILPFSNIAWRVAVSSAVAAAFASGIVAMMTSRGSSMVLESLDEFKSIDRKTENLICVVAGWVAGMLIGFNGFMWSQAVIVEVYTLSVLSLALTMVFLLRWLYEPEKYRWLFWTFLLFGICFTNHQTLICAAMGLQVLIAVARPKLGRDLFLVNIICYTLGLLVKATGMYDLFGANKPLFMIFNVVGIGSIHAFLWLATRLDRPTKTWIAVGHIAVNLLMMFTAMRTGSTIADSTVAWWMFFLNSMLAVAFFVIMVFAEQANTPFSEWKRLLIGGAGFLLGVSFYLYMPLASMTNPPMNWGYPRTVEGFVHAFTRGQYQQTTPTESVGKLVSQLYMLAEGALQEFNGAWLLVAVIPFLFFFRMKRREQAWLSGQVAIYLCLSVLLIVLLNPESDKQSREMNRVFFTASHLMIALCAGYGLTLIGAMVRLHYSRYREYLLYGAGVLCALAFLGVVTVFADTEWPLDRYASLLGMAAAVALLLYLIIRKEQFKPAVLLGIAAILPLYSVMRHWKDSEQRGHLFGYWFGHDMFAPPFTDENGDPLYPDMAENAILFGGTDPGRFCPTYMIFCESFIKPEHRRDPDFDRRDVYIITQNALADATYLDYIRAHYNRSAQEDPPFFQNIFRSQEEIQRGTTNWFARTFMGPLDNIFMGLGAKIEAQRRDEGVYPEEEIYTPSKGDLNSAFTAYSQDAARRRQQGKLRPGEVVNLVPQGDGSEKIQVSGQVSVMAINGLLCKVIFHRNPEHEFYVEESFPLDWMYPHLTPYGIIMKINREPLAQLSEEHYQKDRQFWKQYCDRLIGDWIEEDTPVQEICEFALKVYKRHDYAGFEGDRKFLRDKQAQKAFSKLRGAIAGLYTYRLNQAPSGSPQQQRALIEAEFALKQSFAFYPPSPEAVFRYCNLLVSMPNRIEDAIKVAQTAVILDEGNAQFQSLLDQLLQFRQGRGDMSQQVNQQLDTLVQQFRQNPLDLTNSFNLASAYVQLGETNLAVNVFQTVLDQEGLTPNHALNIAVNARDLGNVPLLETALSRFTQVDSQNPEAYYDLAALQASLNKTNAAMQNLTRAIQLSDRRLESNPDARNLRNEVLAEPRFNQLRNREDYQQMMNDL